MTKRGSSQNVPGACDIHNVTAAATHRLTQTELEMAAGRTALERHRMKHARWRAPHNLKLGIMRVARRPCDPHVKLPTDISATIARGKAAFKQQKTCASAKSIPKVITAVVDQDLQDHRDANLGARETVPKGTRRQPPMVDRVQAVMILVNRLLAEGMPFGVGPNSRMNKAVREWLNERTSRSLDLRKSRRKQITPTAVRELLKQVKAEGRAVPRKAAQRKRTIHEEAAERLRELRARRTTGAD